MRYKLGHCVCLHPEKNNINNKMYESNTYKISYIIIIIMIYLTVGTDFDRQDHAPVLFICKPIYYPVCFTKHEAHPNIISYNT